MGKHAHSPVDGPMSKYVATEKRAKLDTVIDKGRFANYDEFGIYSSVETSSNILTGACVDLSLTYQNQKKQHQAEPIEIFFDPADQNLDAAILASIMDSQGGNTKENNPIETQPPTLKI